MPPLAALLALLLAAPGAAQPPPQTRCELHLWGSDRLSFRTAGLFSELGLVGTRVDRAGRAPGDRAQRPLLAAALDARGQAEALASLPLPLMLSIGDRRVVAHDAPLDPRRAAAPAGRHAGSAAPCYAELIVTGLAFRSSAVAGRRLVASFRYREFGDSDVPRFAFSGRSEGRLMIFPPRDASETEAANRELARTFRAAVHLFAAEMVAARTRQIAREARRRVQD